MRGHVYTVEFRIVSATLDPAAITSELSLQPCQVWLQGSLRADGKVRPGMWAYNGFGSGAGKDYDSLEAGLTLLLDKLWPHREAIVRYQPNANLVWWCGHFQTAFDGGPNLSSSMLARLGTFGAELYIDNYFSSDGGG
jgi:hypothetical protein